MPTSTNGECSERNISHVQCFRFMCFMHVHSPAFACITIPFRYAITLGNIGDYEGTSAKIENGYVFKVKRFQFHPPRMHASQREREWNQLVFACFLWQKHIEKAIKLNPIDPSSHYLLGRWCFGVSFTRHWISRFLCEYLLKSYEIVWEMLTAGLHVVMAREKSSCHTVLCTTHSYSRRSSPAFPKGTFFVWLTWRERYSLKHSLSTLLLKENLCFFFHKAEQLSPGKWKDNMLYIGKVCWFLPTLEENWKKKLK